MIVLVKDNIQLYFMNNSFEAWESAPAKEKNYLNKHIEILININKELKDKFPKVKSVMISSTYRPDNPNSPHFEGRGIDISGIMCENTTFFVKFHYQTKEIKYLQELCRFCYDKGFYNQVISPYGILDPRKPDDIKNLDFLLRTHKDHFHLNIPK